MRASREQRQLERLVMVVFLLIALCSAFLTFMRGWACKHIGWNHDLEYCASIERNIPIHITETGQTITVDEDLVIETCGTAILMDGDNSTFESTGSLTIDSSSCKR